MDDGLEKMLWEIEQREKAAEIDDISKNISDTYLWVLCALGIPGNIFTFVSVLTMGKTSTATLLVVLLAFYDGVALIAKLTGHLIVHKIYLGTVGCKLMFTPIFLTTMANWTLALIALERFFSVCFPLQKVYLFTKKLTCLIAAVNAVIIFVIYATVFAVVYEDNDTGMVCGVKQHYLNFFQKGWYWINSLLSLFLPFLISAVLTALIILGLTRSRKVRRSMTQGNENQSLQGKAQDNNRKLIKETERAERMITIMLILASVLFVVLSLPACIYFLATTESDDIVVTAKWKLYKQISYILLDSTHAINFFLYFVSAKRFRNHFISLVTCKRFPRRRDYSYVGSNPTESSKMSTTM